MKYLTFLMAGAFLFFGCSESAVQHELKIAKEELKAAKSAIQILQSQMEPEGELVHLVFFQLKPDADQAALISAIHTLEDIEVVRDLEVGPFEDLGDERALRTYDLVVQMSFDDADAYQVYQVHPIHLALREKAQAFLAAPPATYDFMKK